MDFGGNSSNGSVRTYSNNSFEMRNSTQYKITGTKTFRLSSSKILGRWGSNLQNVEKEMRRLYVPDDGKIFVQVDQSGAEALIVAYLSRAGDYRKLFTNGIKPHVYVGMNLFKGVWQKKMIQHNLLSTGETFDINEICGTEIALLKQHRHWKNLDALIKDSDNWSISERYYYLAKQTEHSSNYDIQAPTFQMNILEKSGGKIVINKEQAQFFLDTKHGLFPEIKEWHAEVRRTAEKSRRLYNLHGHPYEIIRGELRESDWKELYAWIPQSTVGEITNIAYVAMQNFIEEQNLDWSLLANTHDSYLLQCPIVEVADCARQGKIFMEQSFVSPVDGTPFSMRSEAAVGFNWSPYKKEKNELGLKEIKL